MASLSDRHYLTPLFEPAAVAVIGATDVGFGESIDYLVADEATGHILLHIEGVRSARRFVSALRAAA